MEMPLQIPIIIITIITIIIIIICDFKNIDIDVETQEGAIVQTLFK